MHSTAYLPRLQLLIVVLKCCWSLTPGEVFSLGTLALATTNLANIRRRLQGASAAAAFGSLVLVPLEGALQYAPVLALLQGPLLWRRSGAICMCMYMYVYM